MTTRHFMLAGLIALSTTVGTRAGLEADTLPAELSPLDADVPVEIDVPAEAPAATVVATPTAAAVAPVTVDSVPQRRRPLTAVAAVGRSDGEVVVGMIALDYHFDWQRAIGKHGVISPYCEFLLGYWEGEEGHTGVTSLHEAGLSLLLRYRYIRQPLATFHPYIDAGVGLHYLTEDRIEGKELGRNWQAGSNIGIGLLFPRDERFELGLRLRHLSNAGTDDFNWGVNQLLARFGVRF